MWRSEMAFARDAWRLDHHLLDAGILQKGEGANNVDDNTWRKKI